MQGELSHALATHLRALRKSKHMTQEAFALRYGIGRTWLGVLESGKRNITFKTVEDVAAKVQVSPFFFTRPVATTGPIPDLSGEPPRERDEEGGGGATEGGSAG